MNNKNINKIEYLLNPDSYKNLNEKHKIDLSDGHTMEPTTQGLIGLIGLFLHILESHTDKYST